MEENDKIIAIAILPMLALIALIGFILYKIVIYKKSISNINMAAPSSVPVKNNNFKLVDPNTIIKIKKNDGKEIPKGADLGKLISVKKKDRVTNRIYQKEIIENGKIITIRRLTKQEKGGEERLFNISAKESVAKIVNGVPTATYKKPYGEGPYDMGIGAISCKARGLEQQKVDNNKTNTSIFIASSQFNNLMSLKDLDAITPVAQQINNQNLNGDLIEFSSSSENSSINSNSASTGSDEGFVEISVNDDLDNLSNNEADYNFKKAKLRLSSDEEGDVSQANSLDKKAIKQTDSLDKKVIKAFGNLMNKTKDIANNAAAAIFNITSNNKPNENTPLLKEERQAPFFNNLESNDPLKGNEESKIDKLKSGFNSALNTVSNGLSNFNPLKRGRSLSVHSYDGGSDSE